MDFNVTGQSNVDGLLLASYTTNSGSLFPVGTTTVTATVKDNAGQTATTSFTVTVTAPPAITEQPVSLTVNQGESAQFTVTATTPGGVTNVYQWRKNGVNISGAIQPTYSIAAAQSADAGSYEVVVSNIAGSVVSASAILSVTVPPTITQQPVSQTVDGGATVSFTVVATVSGEVPNVYQWRRNGLNINGATQAAHTIVAAQPTDAGSYDVVISNTAGSVTSAIAVLTVNLPQGVTIQKANNSTALDQSGSWTEGIIPGPADIALWNGTYDSANASAPVGSGISAKQLRVTAPSRAMAIAAGAGSLNLGGLDGVGIDMSTATQNFTIHAPVVITSSQSWVVNSGRSLVVNGGVSESTSGLSLAKTGAGTLTLGGAQTITGILDVAAGTLNLGGSSAMTIGNLNGSTGSGIITYANTYSGGNSLNIASGVQSFSRIGNTSLNGSMTVNASGSTINVGALGYNLNTGWSTTLNGGIWTVGNIGLNSTGSQNGGTYHITGGASVSVTTSRFGGHGTYNVGGPGGAGTLTFGSGLSSENGGALGFMLNALAGGQINFPNVTFALPKAGVTATNGLAVQENSLVTVNGNLALGNTTAGKTESNTVNLTGGALRVSGTIQAAAATVGQTRVFNWTGGQLTAANMIAGPGFNTPSAGGISATGLVQSAGTLAPGDVTTAGRTVITGGYNLGSGGALAIELGGTTQATAYQTGEYDYLNVSGSTTLGGQLQVGLIQGFTPASGNSFTIVNSTGGLTGAFSNVTAGRVTTTDGAGSFAVTYTATQVVLNDYQEAPLQQMAILADGSPSGPVPPGLLEYALGAGASPNAHQPPALERVGERMAIRFSRLRGDVTYIVEASSDLVKWDVIEENPGNVGEQVTVTDTADLSSANPSQRFMRVRVVKP